MSVIVSADHVAGFSTEIWPLDVLLLTCIHFWDEVCIASSVS